MSGNGHSAEEDTEGRSGEERSQCHMAGAAVACALSSLPYLPKLDAGISAPGVPICKGGDRDLRVTDLFVGLTASLCLETEEIWKFGIFPPSSLF